jgi:hypothetical protein
MAQPYLLVNPDLPALEARVSRARIDVYVWRHDTLQEDPGCLTDAGTWAFASALAAAEPAERPTLECLCLGGHPATGAGTAAALATAPFRHISHLLLIRMGALQLDRKLLCPLTEVCAAMSDAEAEACKSGS